MSDLILPVDQDQSPFEFELLADAVTTLGLEHKIKLWQMLGQEIAQAHKIVKSNSEIKAIESLDHSVRNVLAESGMTEDELVAAFVGFDSQFLKVVKY